MNAATRGRAAFHMFVSAALEAGFESFIPLAEESPADLLLLRNGAYERVQIKRVFEHQGHPVINLKRRDGSRYKMSEIDTVAAVDVQKGLIWLIPFEKLWDKDAGQPKGRLRLTTRWDMHILLGEHP